MKPIKPESFEQAIIRVMGKCHICPFNTAIDCEQHDCQFRQLKLKIEKDKHE